MGDMGSAWNDETMGKFAWKRVAWRTMDIRDIDVDVDVDVPKPRENRKSVYFVSLGRNLDNLMETQTAY